MMIRVFALTNADVPVKGDFVKEDMIKRRSRALWRIASIGFLCVAVLLWGCASSNRFPRGYRQSRTDLRIWQNTAEGFSLTLITNPDRAQGFVEWGKLGIYGRIVDARKTGDTMSISLGDGGMNGVRLHVFEKKNMIEVRCELSKDAPTVLQNQVSRANIVAERVVSLSALKILTGTFKEKQRNGRDISIRLQYVTSSATLEMNVLDEVLRRGKTVRDAAIFRRAQQEETPVVLYEQGVPEPSRGSPRASAQPQMDAQPQSPLVYEEIQYPVFVSTSILSVATQRYLFNGGAHGAASTEFDIIDLSSDTRLGADDVLKGGWRNALLPALSAELLRQGTYVGVDPKGGLKALGLFEPELTAPDKVFMCMMGLGFEYDRYQIAPWAMGEYIVVLPWDQVRPYLATAIKPF